VNLEADVIGKYVARLLGDRLAAPEHRQTRGRFSGRKD
jgi:riboflavin synthase alpha subunit